MPRLSPFQSNGPTATSPTPILGMWIWMPLSARIIPLTASMTVLIAPLMIPVIPSQTSLIPRWSPENASPMPFVTEVATSQAVCQTTPIASKAVDITVSSTDAAAPTRGNATSATFVITGMTALNTAATASIALFTKPATWPMTLEMSGQLSEIQPWTNAKARWSAGSTFSAHVSKMLWRGGRMLAVSQSITLPEGRDDVVGDEREGVGEGRDDVGHEPVDGLADGGEDAVHRRLDRGHVVGDPGEQPCQDRQELLADRHGCRVHDLAPQVAEVLRLCGRGADRVGPVDDRVDEVVGGEAALEDRRREVRAGAQAERLDGVADRVRRLADRLDPGRELGAHVGGRDAVLGERLHPVLEARERRLGVDALLLPLGEQRDRLVEGEAEQAHRRAEVDDLLHEGRHPDPGRLGGAEHLVEGPRLVLGRDAPVAEQPGRVADVVVDVGLGDPAEVEQVDREGFEGVAGGARPGVEVGDHLADRLEVVGHALRGPAERLDQGVERRACGARAGPDLVDARLVVGRHLGGPRGHREERRPDDQRRLLGHVGEAAEQALAALDVGLELALVERERRVQRADRDPGGHR